MNGIILINKKPAQTSADVVSKIKPLVYPKKIGHGGTLDPEATGLLIVLIGKATKFQSFLLECYKSYSGVIKLGISTSTDDVYGDILETKPVPNKEILDARLCDVLSFFTGEIMQRPPQFSAIKISGKRAYTLAREGSSFTLAERLVRIKELKLEMMDDTRLSYDLTCSSGTYVRSLARDIGNFLSTCGCAESICRTSIGKFHLHSAICLDHLLALRSLESVLIPLEYLVQDIPCYTFTMQDCLAIRNGKQNVLEKLNIKQEIENYPRAAILDPLGQLVAILQSDTENIRWNLSFVI